MSNSDKIIVDGVSAVTTVAALFQYLPAIASLLSVVWMAIRIYETRTIQRLLGRKDDCELVDKD